MLSIQRYCLTTLRQSLCVANNCRGFSRPIKRTNYRNFVSVVSNDNAFLKASSSQCLLLSRSKTKKDKAKAKKGSKVDNAGVVVEGDSDIMVEYKGALQEVTDELKQQYTQNLKLRTNTSSFETMIIETKQGSFPLNQIALVVKKNPTFVSIEFTGTVEYIPNVIDALAKSGMNLNPRQEGGSTIYVPIAKVTREHQENLAKSANTLFNTQKAKYSKVYQKYMKLVDKDNTIKGATQKRDFKEELLVIMKKVQNNAEIMMKQKQKELLE